MGKVDQRASFHAVQLNAMTLRLNDLTYASFYKILAIFFLIHGFLFLPALPFTLT